MIRSMTGFGAAERGIPSGRLRVEIRTVNHRYFHTTFRLPHALAAQEAEIRDWLRSFLSRGHASCAVRIDSEGADPGGIRIDEGRVRAYLAAFRDLSERYGLSGEPDLALIARYNDIFLRDAGEEEAPEIPVGALREAVEEAARQAVEMREQEGRRLGEDLEGRLGEMEAALSEIGARAPERLVAERDRLREAVRELSAGVGVNEDRLAQEIAHLAERWDISEERVRFDAHIAHFRQLLTAEAAEPVGKRLSFLVQEMHREANTIGSKANDALIAHRVVAIKEEIERLREQVENVE